MATLAQIADELGSSPAALAREAIIGSPASIIATTLAEMKGSLAEMGLSGSAAALASMRATIPEGLLSSLKAPEGLLTAFEQPAWMAASLTAGLDRAYLLPEHDMPAARGLIEQFERDDRAWQMAKQALEGSDQWRKLLEPALTARALWPEPEQLAGIYRQVEQYNLNLMADALSASQAPAALTRRPEPQPPPKRLPPPQSGNFGIQPAQPGQPADLLTQLADALRAGRAKPFEVISLVAQVATLPPQAELLAELSELEALDQAWRKVKGQKTPTRFAAEHHMSKATLYRRWERLKVLRWLLGAWPGGETS